MLLLYSFYDHIILYYYCCTVVSYRCNQQQPCSHTATLTSKSCCFLSLQPTTTLLAHCNTYNQVINMIVSSLPASPYVSPAPTPSTAPAQPVSAAVCNILRGHLSPRLLIDHSLLSVVHEMVQHWYSLSCVWIMYVYFAHLALNCLNDRVRENTNKTIINPTYATPTQTTTGTIRNIMPLEPLSEWTPLDYKTVV